MRHFITIIVLLFPGQITLGQIHQDWRKKDINLIDSIIKLDRNNPTEVENFFNKYTDKQPKDTLGFGWTKFEQGIGAGYISIWANFFYYRDTIQTYILVARLPYQKELADEYKSLYLKFIPNDTGNIFFYKYNEQNILKPLKELAGNQKPANISKKMLEYMSPTSGDTYGFMGGLPMTTVQNRKLFNELKDSLTPDQLIAMMYSINPVSRLTAIEYYFKNSKKYNFNKQVNKWIEKVFKEVPTIKTISGCIAGHESSKSLVEEFAKTKFD
jgi:hypothetical protein